MRDPTHFSIMRDAPYRRTYQCDMWRQTIRRFTHKIACIYERLAWHPRWQKKNQTGSFQKPVPTLSTCIITMNSANRIRPLLTYIRTFSDEIVVGVDSKTTDNTLDACQGLADELFVVQNDTLTCNSGLDVLVSRCHGDWVLRLDDDEFPEPHFEVFKAGLLTSSLFTHYKLPRLHLSQVNEAATQSNPSLEWINDGYLYPDFQMRLFRNDPNLLSFPGAVGHTNIHCEGPRGKINTVNLVHLNMAINPRFKREEKLETYIRRLNGAWVHPINEHALLFENFNYRIEPYNFPDKSFCQLLEETVLTQRRIYEAAAIRKEETAQTLG